MWIARHRFEDMQRRLDGAQRQEGALNAEIDALRAQLAARAAPSPQDNEAAMLRAVITRMAEFGTSLTDAQGSLGEMARLLRDELETWRVRLQGEGQFEVELSRPKAAQPGTMGVVRIGLSAGRPKRAGTPAAVEHVLQQLRGDDAFPQVGGEGLTVASDLLLFHGGDYYFVKPLVRRLWLATAAAQDAWRIVQTVRQGAPIQ